MSEDNNLFQRIKKVRVSDSVVDQILTLIDEGELEVGDQLPGERELVSQWQVARASVREAFRMLEAKGIIEVRPGKGAFVVGDTVRSEGEEQLRLWFQEHVHHVTDVLEIREALECRAAQLAANKASEDDINALTSIMEAAQESIDEENFNKLVHLDRQFHRKIAEATGIQLFTELIDVVINAMVDPRRSLMRLPNRAQESWRDHQVIVDAITSRNPDLAEAAMIGHMASVRRAIAALLVEQAHEENG